MNPAIATGGIGDMGSGTDTFSGTLFEPATWSEHVTPIYAHDGVTVIGVTVVAPGSTEVTLTGTVAAAGDTVELVRTSDDFEAGLAAVFDVPGGIVLTDGSGDYFAFFSQPYTVGQHYDAVAGFGHFASAGSDPACFVAGTRIRALAGFVPVDDLRPGDVVATLIGRLPAAIVWIGRRQVRCDRHPRPWDVRPVRVAAAALAPGVPARDLYLSPDHALLIDGALVPVRHLLNGVTITQVARALVTYHHVELARHDVLDAEGAPAESYLDTGNRASFGAAGQGRATDRPTPCLPLLTDGPRLYEIRRHLLLRAHALGHRLSADPALRIAADGQPLATDATGPTYRTTFPIGATTIRLDSRIGRPADTDTGERDCRPLGVCVVGLRLDGADVPLDDPALRDGWHVPEGAMRWTDGGATLLVAPAARQRELLVMTSHQLRYWIPRSTECRAGDLAPDNATVMRRPTGDRRFVLQFDDGRAHPSDAAEQRRSPRRRGGATPDPGPRNREGNRHDHRRHPA